MYLESSAHAEDSVVGFFRGQALEGEFDDFIFFGDEIIGSEGRVRLAKMVRIESSCAEGSMVAIELSTYLRPSCL
jgi:hypothetical protein